MFRSSLFTLVLVFSFCSFSYAQESLALAEADLSSPLPKVKVLEDRFFPVLPSGESLLRRIQSQITYPDIAIENSVEGTVVIEANISATGLLKDYRIVRSVALLDSAALEAVRQLPIMLPSVEGGKAVARRLYIPLRFRLQ